MIRGKTKILRATLVISLAFLLVAVASTIFAGCVLGEGRLEEEYSKGYQAGQAAAEAELNSSAGGLQGEEAQHLLSALGEGQVDRLEIREYSIEGDVCLVYGVQFLKDQTTRNFSLRLEKDGGVWKVAELHEPGFEGM